MTKYYKFTLGKGDEKIVLHSYFTITGTDIVIINEQEAIVNKLKSKKNTFKVVRRTTHKNGFTIFHCKCLTISSHDSDIISI